MRKNMCENLDRLQQSLKTYCPDDVNFELRIRNSFLADLDAVCDDDLAKNNCTELRTLQMLRTDFNLKNVAEFWFSLTHVYSSLVKREPWLLFAFCYKLPLRVGIFGFFCY